MNTGAGALRKNSHPRSGIPRPPRGQGFADRPQIAGGERSARYPCCSRQVVFRLHPQPAQLPGATQDKEGRSRQSAISLLAVAGALTASVVAAQEKPASAQAQGALASVHITQSVLANGKPLPAGVYQLRLTNEHPTPLPGQSPDAERWVEFVANGIAVAREVAVVLRDDDLPSIGASSVPTRDGTRVEMLQGGEFLRISVKRGHERYLVYLPGAR